MGNPFSTAARGGDAKGKGDPEDDAFSAYPVPGTGVVVGADAASEQDPSAYSYPIPLGIQPPQRTTLDPTTGGSSDIAGGVTPPFTIGPGSGVVAEVPGGLPETLRNLDASTQRLVQAITLQGTTIIRLVGGAGPVNAAFAPSSHLRLRVRYLIASRTTAGIGSLTVGSETYDFDLPASMPIIIPFPLVLERGVDLSFTGDGRCYVIADPE